MVDRSNKEFAIPFVGLKLGKHIFEFDITDKFFEEFEYSLIRSGKVHVVLTLEKKETMMIGEFELNGKVFTDCDRCNDPLEVPVKGSYRIVYKFDTEAVDDESLIVLFPEEFEINVRETILELITVSLPTRNLHNEGECNEEMIELLNEYSANSDKDSWNADDDDENDETDPRWEALKKLK